jgi:O-6-methylguanine DNA methyltransferase
MEKTSASATACYPFGHGYLIVTHDGGAVAGIKLAAAPPGEDRRSAVSDSAAAQIREYFALTRSAFDFPMRPQGTAFQMKVRAALLDIPYGQTRTYAQIAASAGSPRARRAAGQACRNNPLWLAVPCHRVIGGNGALTGYGGGLEMKRALLELEQEGLRRMRALGQTLQEQ